MDENSEQLRDEMTILGMHIQRFFVEDHRPWAEDEVERRSLSFASTSTGHRCLKYCMTKFHWRLMQLLYIYTCVKRGHGEKFPITAAQVAERLCLHGKDETPRSPPTASLQTKFFGPLSTPKWTQAEVKKRVTTNMSFFSTNYLIICVVCCAFYILRSPGLLLTLLLSLCMFLYVFMSRRKPLVIMDVTLGTREKIIAASLGALVMLSFTGYIFALQWSGALGCTLCLLHATFRPPVARALRGSALGGGGDPELQMGDGDVEGGVGRGRPAPVNANIRLRSRPAIGGVGPGMSAPPMGGGASLREGIAPMDSTSGNGLMRTHPHGN